MHLGKNFLFSLGAGNTLALPLELEQNQFIIGFKVWSGTFLQPSMNQSYPVEAELALANHLPGKLFCLGPLKDRKYSCNGLTSS